jgi:hypothetical protein
VQQQQLQGWHCKGIAFYVTAYMMQQLQGWQPAAAGVRTPAASAGYEDNANIAKHTYSVCLIAAHLCQPKETFQRQQPKTKLHTTEGHEDEFPQRFHDIFKCVLVLLCVVIIHHKTCRLLVGACLLLFWRM